MYDYFCSPNRINVFYLINININIDITHLLRSNRLYQINYIIQLVSKINLASSVKQKLYRYIRNFICLQILDIAANGEEVERARGRNAGAREVEKAQHGHGSNSDRTARDNWIFVDLVSPPRTARFILHRQKTRDGISCREIGSNRRVDRRMKYDALAETRIRPSPQRSNKTR